MSDGWRVEFIGGPYDGEEYPLQEQHERLRRGIAMYRTSTIDPVQQVMHYRWEQTDRDPVRVNLLTALAFVLNAAMDAGEHDALPIDDVKRVIRDGTVFTFLEEKLGEAISLDLSLLEPPVRGEIIRDWQDLADAVDEGRKFGVNRSGLSLLVAYVLEGIRRRAGWVEG